MIYIEKLLIRSDRGLLTGRFGVVKNPSEPEICYLVEHSMGDSCRCSGTGRQLSDAVS